MSHRNAYILLSLVALLWAGNFPASKIGLSELGPLTLTTARAVLVTPVLIALARLLHGPFPTFRRRDYVTFVISWAVLGEPIRWYHAVGATVVIAGVGLTTKR